MTPGSLARPVGAENGTVALSRCAAFPIAARHHGRAVGVDYITLRADGRIDLNIQADITTDDGEKIALAASGVAIPKPGSPVVALRENVMLTTASETYAWVNLCRSGASARLTSAPG